MEKKDESLMTSDDDCYVKSTTRAIIGTVNGMVFYDLVYPIIYLLIIQLILGASYATMVETNGLSVQLILSLLSSLTTLVVGIIIANPKNLIKSIGPIKIDEIKLIIFTLVTMFAFTFGYNFIVTLLGVDIGGGNTNQSSIVDYIKALPILAFLAFVIIGPILEEVTYRYFLFGGLRKINPMFAIIGSGFIFMLVHGLAGFISSEANILKELILLPPYMFSGCMLAHSYNKSDNLAVSISVHMLNNLISFMLSASLV